MTCFSLPQKLPPCTAKVPFPHSEKKEAGL